MNEKILIDILSCIVESHFSEEYIEKMLISLRDFFEKACMKSIDKKIKDDLMFCIKMIEEDLE